MPHEIVELRGHLIDSLILPKVLDTIMALGAHFEIQQIEVGVRPQDASFARLLIAHDDPRKLESVLRAVARHGAEPVERREAQLKRAPRDGVLPPDFYATTNLETAVYLAAPRGAGSRGFRIADFGSRMANRKSQIKNRKSPKARWVRVRNPEMDGAIRVARSRRAAETVKMAGVRKGDLIVVGHRGVRVVPVESRRAPEDFEFMTSEVSTEKPKGILIRRIAGMMKAERAAGRPILWVCGPAVVHSGAAPLLEKLVEAGYVQRLFAGNALAAHDIECALFGTSLGVSMREGASAPSGHENHLRAINAIRAAGGIRQAVRKGLLTRGILAACVRRKVDVVLAGSIRDDGPLPEVITDTLRAQDAMRRRCRRVRLALFVATLLHSVATGNMLPAATRVVCADIQPAAVTKLLDRGTFQTLGLVTDVQPFLRELLLELKVG